MLRLTLPLSPDFCSDRLSGDYDLDPPVLLPASGCVVTRDWIGLSHARGCDISGIQPLAHQERSHPIRALPGEGQVQGWSAGAVGVSLDAQLQAGMRQDDSGESS